MQNDASNDHSEGFVTSMDGKRTIPLEELDRLFDEGSDEIDDFIDWEKAEALEPEPEPLPIAFPTLLLEGLSREATRVGVTPDALVKMWVTERLEALVSKVP